jgi:hypothetical protein
MPFFQSTFVDVGVSFGMLFFQSTFDDVGVSFGMLLFFKVLLMI